MPAENLRALPSRVPPHDAHAEAIVIAACMLDQNRFDLISGTVVTPEDFYLDAHRQIFRAVTELRLRGQPYDLVAIAAWLKDHDRLQQVGGTPFLSQLVDYTEYVVNLEEHARAVALFARRRRLIAECQRVSAEGYAAIEDTEAWLDTNQSALVSASETGQFQETQQTLHEAVEAELLAFTLRGQTQAPPAGAFDPSLGRSFAELLPYAEPGDLMVVAGRPGHGKTALGLGIALHAAQQDIPTGFWTLEMSIRQIARRALAQDGNVSFSDLRRGKFTDGHHYVQMARAGVRLGSVPMVLDERAAPTVGQLRSAIRRGAARLDRKKLGVAVIDYLQLVDGLQAKGEPRENAVGRVSKGLKQTAKEMGMIIVALAQLNRAIEGERRRNSARRPNLGDLRESGQIEQDADYILFVHQDDKYIEKIEDRTGEAEVILAKQRNGDTGTVRFRYHGPSMRFDPIGDEGPEAF